MARRQEKYPDTNTFKYHNQNPYDRITGDCTTRAISYATGIPYNQVVMDHAMIHCETGYWGDKSVEALMKKYGWKKMKQPRKANGKKYTVREFVESFKVGTYVINMAGHMSVVEDGKNVDIWDCVKYGGCVGNYFIKA